MSNVSNSIMLWCMIMLIQLCSSGVCSFSYNLSVKVIVQCVLVFVIICILQSTFTRGDSSWWNIALSITPITVVIIIIRIA